MVARCGRCEPRPGRAPRRPKGAVQLIQRGRKSCQMAATGSTLPGRASSRGDRRGPMFESDDDGLEFLDEEDSDDQQLRAALERYRPEIVAWSAAAGVARTPQHARGRGPKGRLLWQQEMNLHLIRVHEATVTGGAEGLRLYASWARRRLRARSGGVDDLQVTVALLLEGLARHLNVRHARTLVGDLSAAFAIPPPAALAAYLELNPPQG